MPPAPLTAVVVGATGLVGRALVAALLVDPAWSRVVVLARRPLTPPPPAPGPAELVEHVVDFERPATYADHVRGDVLFSALGTTRKDAGGVAAQRRVDHDYQLEVARAARAGGVPTVVVVSSAGAAAGSPFAYPRMKGELERDVAALGFERVRLLRPGPLDGPRAAPRTGERLALGVLRPLASVLPATARPIHADVVARAAIAAARDPAPGVRIVEAAELFRSGA